MDEAWLRPDNLIVVGAAGGMARLIAGAVLSTMSWNEVWLLDTREAVLALDPGLGGGAIRRIVLPGDGVVPDVRSEQLDSIRGVDAAILLAVPQSSLPTVSQKILPLVGARSVAFDIASEKTAAIASMLNARPGLAAFGTHPLFGHAVGTVSGQTVVICPAADGPDVHSWFAKGVEAAGGAVKEMSAERHDLVMAYVQTAAHQALITFADVVGSSGMDVERDLWECRTPQFETLLAMASRVLTKEQVQTIASIQLTTAGGRIGEEVSEAHARLQHRIRSGSLKDLEDHLTGIGGLYRGSVFNRMQQASNLATKAVQSARLSLAGVRRVGELVGACPKGDMSRLRVGEVVSLTTTTLVLQNLLLGKKGSAILAGRNTRAARKLGVSGKASLVEFSLGNVDLFFGGELESLLEEWLGSVEIDVRVLGPESVSGRSICRTALDSPIVQRAALMSEAVRVGQRECVIRCSIRADHDPANLAVDIQALADQRYGWPAHSVKAPAKVDGEARVGFLGPPGTFSGQAAAELADALPDQSASLRPYGDFTELLGGLRADEIDFVVIPLSNSATGLVDAAASALGSYQGQLEGCGVVDVRIRFDAYSVTPAIRPGSVVVSQSQALLQCKRFVSLHRLVQEESSSTIEAIKQLVAGTGDIALAPSGVAAPVGIHVVASDVGDLPGAITRFVVLVDPSGSPRWHFPQTDDSSVATLRSVWLLSPSAVFPGSSGCARYDEVIEGSSGRRLVISTDPLRLHSGAGVQFLGTFMWSPRTPIVSV